MLQPYPADPPVDVTTPASAERDVAVIDVGSNSVRLVLYRVEGRAIWTVFNEKVLAGLGRRTGDGRRLSPEGTRTALAALRRFHAVLGGAETTEVFAVATAAVREAEDGAAFIARVHEETGLRVRVLSGAEEARYAALGVIAGQADAGGVVGDLGGSSLELIRIAGGDPAEGVTLPLGPFALGASGANAGGAIDLAAARARIADRLRSVAPRFRAGCFYAVGGAWRNIALIQMETANYPLRLVHQYEMNAREALEAARFVARQSRASLEQIPGVSRKRAETLPYAALVLEGLIEHLGLERICMSAFGLREGLILEAMPQALRALDPLVAGCAALGARQGVAERLGPALQSWLTPLWSALAPVFNRSAISAAPSPSSSGPSASGPSAPGPFASGPSSMSPSSSSPSSSSLATLAGPAPSLTDEVPCAPPHVPRDDVLLAAACRLADLGARLHPDHRADLAFDQVLRAPIPGQSHAERAFLATAIFARHTAQAPGGSVVDRLLSPERMRRARALGAAMRLGCDLSGRAPDLLAGCTLTLERGGVVLTIPPASADLLLGEQTRKRLHALAGALEVEGRVRIC